MGNTCDPEEYLKGDDLKEYNLEVEFLDTLDILYYFEKESDIKVIMEDIEELELDDYNDFLDENYGSDYSKLYGSYIFNQMNHWEFYEYLKKRYGEDHNIFIEEVCHYHVHIKSKED